MIFKKEFGGPTMWGPHTNVSWDPIQMFLGTAQRSDSLILFFCSAFNLAFNQRVLPSKLINLYKKFNPRRHIRVQDRTFMIE